MTAKAPMHASPRYKLRNISVLPEFSAAWDYCALFPRGCGLMDIFMPALGGHLLDRFAPGGVGYRYFFLLLALFSVAGIGFTLVYRYFGRAKSVSSSRNADRLPRWDSSQNVKATGADRP